MFYAKYFYMLGSDNKYFQPEEIIIPDSVTNIGNNQFYGFENLMKIVIPTTVKFIGEDAFAECINLIIFSEYKNEHFGWNQNWNSSDRPIIWDHIEEDRQESNNIFDNFSELIQGIFEKIEDFINNFMSRLNKIISSLSENPNDIEDEKEDLYDLYFG